MVDGELYKKAKNGPLLKCVTPFEADYILREIHEGCCGHHLGARALAYKAIIIGYYWPTATEDARNMVQRCEKCQKFALNIIQPASKLKYIHNPVPFAQWGLDLLGPFKQATRGKKFLIVAIDYFTKWVEAESLGIITSRKVEKFIWQNIITRFGLPRVLTFDNGTQFDCATLRKYLEDFKIAVAYSSVCNPQRAEATNKQILNALQKSRKTQKPDGWINDVLCSLRTTVKETTGQTPFRLVYGLEALLPVEIRVQTRRFKHLNQEENQESKLLDLELIDEVRENTTWKMAAYQNRIARLYNRKVKHRSF